MDKVYESMVIVRPELTDEEVEGIFNKLLKRIESLGGRNLSGAVWAKERPFSYPLAARGAEKKKYHKGCFWLLTFILDTDKLGDVRETIRLEERILRYILLQRKHEKEVK